MKKSARRPKTQFVPKVVYRTAFAGVVPLCVAAGTACGGSTAGGDAGTSPSVACSGFACGVGAMAYDGGRDTGPDVGQFIVACAGFCGVAAVAFDSGTNVPDANDRPDAIIFSVACFAFDGGPCGLPPPIQDAAPDVDATPPGPCPGGGYGCLTVAMKAFDGGGDKG